MKPICNKPKSYDKYQIYIIFKNKASKIIIQCFAQTEKVGTVQKKTQRTLVIVPGGLHPFHHGFLLAVKEGLQASLSNRRLPPPPPP